ncbi:MAG TPA: sigma-70 family RNA polymerase sigma factor [Bryobacteraceae bacterium]|nr:sigma-70 family RNA polymerase sigma factor [Bryobacteraceae bacterium]
MEPVRFDENYVGRLKARDPQTESHFAAYFSELLLIKLRKTVRSPQLISDVRQETLLRVLEIVRKGGLAHPERLGAFVCAVCNNVLLEHLRAEGRFEGGAPVFEPADERIRPEQELINQDRQRQVRSILAELSDKDRVLLRMVFFEETSREEVCRRLEVTPEYLRVVLHRAKARFREKFLALEGQRGETRSLGISQ